MRTRSRLLGAAATLAAGILILSGCSASPSTSSATATSAQTLSIGMATPVVTFTHSLLNGGSDEVYWRAVYTTLLTRTTKDVLKPDAAKSWKYNADNTVLDFTLRSGMKFTDGTPVNAKAAVASLLDMKNGQGPDRVRFNHVSTIKTTGDLTFQVDFTSPDPAFLDYMSFDSGSIANPKDLTASDSATNPQGSGPYVLDQSKTTIGSVYTFTRNKGYWDQKSYPYDTVVIKVLPDVSSRLNALKSGQINATQLDGTTAAAAKASGLSYITQLGNLDGLQIRDTTGATVPALGSQDVRQAMNMVFDRASIVKNLLQGFGQPTDQQFINTSQAFLKGQDNHYKYDIAAAKKLMAEGGYPNGFNLTLPTESSQTFINPTLQQSLGEIGIKVKFVTVPDAQWTVKMLAGDYPVYFQQASSRTAWIDLGLWIGPGSTWNTFKPPSNDPQLTALINQAQTAKGAQADAIYQKIGKRLLTLAWFVPMYRAEAVDAVDSKTNVTYTPEVANPLIQNYSPKK
jgi:peptide/nickel transport system substrate-binding protein